MLVQAWRPVYPDSVFRRDGNGLAEFARIDGVQLVEITMAAEGKPVPAVTKRN
jgi:hypothetical protein